MSGTSADEFTEPITIRLTHEQLGRLDQLRSERNLSRGQLIGELVEQAKPRRARRRTASGRQDPNPWAQVWPGGKA